VPPGPEFYLTVRERDVAGNRNQLASLRCGEFMLSFRARGKESPSPEG